MTDRKPHPGWQRRTSDAHGLRLRGFDLLAWKDGRFEVTSTDYDGSDDEDANEGEFDWVTHDSGQASSMDAAKIECERSLDRLLTDALEELRRRS